MADRQNNPWQFIPHLITFLATVIGATITVTTTYSAVTSDVRNVVTVNQQQQTEIIEAKAKIQRLEEVIYRLSDTTGRIETKVDLIAKRVQP